MPIQQKLAGFIPTTDLLHMSPSNNPFHRVNIRLCYRFYRFDPMSGRTVPPLRNKRIVLND